MRKYFAEFIGTFALTFIGTATVAIANTGETAVGIIGIALAFGLTVTVMAYALGNVSGGHFNPAVTLAMIVNKRQEAKEGIIYMVSQFLGATAASAILSIFIKALDLAKDGYGQTDFSAISATQALLVEGLLTFLFVFVIIMVTSQKYGNAQMAPLAIGLTLTLLIFVGINVTGTSLNPARSFGPAIFAGGTALNHYWVYLVAPLLGGALAAVVGRFMGSEEI